MDWRPRAQDTRTMTEQTELGFGQQRDLRGATRRESEFANFET